jgi:parvulin-like peptidyl-prolyl isomerase
MTSACATHLEDYYFGENGIMIPPEEDIRAYFDENYYHAKHILIMSVDPDTNEEYSEDELAEREQLAKEIAQRAANGEDFDTLMNEYSEDTGLSSNPDGYVFTEGDMVTEFYDGTAALAVGEISEPIKSSYGWHIIERLPLTDDDYEANRDDVRVAASGSDINTLALEWIDAADVQTTDLYDSITFDNIDTYKAKAVE